MFEPTTGRDSNVLVNENPAFAVPNSPSTTREFIHPNVLDSPRSSTDFIDTNAIDGEDVPASSMAPISRRSSTLQKLFDINRIFSQRLSDGGEVDKNMSPSRSTNWRRSWASAGFARSRDTTDITHLKQFNFEDFEIRSAIGNFDYNILVAEDQDYDERTDKRRTYQTDSWQTRVRLQVLWWLCLWQVLWAPTCFSFGWIAWPCDAIWFCRPTGGSMRVDVFLEVMFVLFAVVLRFYVSIPEVLTCKEWNTKKTVRKLTLQSTSFWLDVTSILFTFIGYLIPITYPYTWILRFLPIQHIIATQDSRVLNPTAHRKVGGHSLLWLLFFVFVFGHIVACFWFFAVTRSFHGGMDQLLLRLTERSNADLGIPEVGERTVYSHYEWSLFWAIQTLTSLEGPVADNVRERLALTFVVPICTLVMGLVLSRMLGIVHALTLMSAHNNMHSQFLECAMLNLGLPTLLMERISRYHNYASLSMNAPARESLVSTISENINCELQLFLFHTLINSAPFFQTLRPTSIVHVVRTMETISLSPGDIIIRKGQVGKEMFFLIKGSVEVCGSYTGEPVFAVKKEGDYFGEIALALNAPRTAWVRARSYCRIAKLTKRNIDEVFLDSPEQKQAIIESITRLENLSSQPGYSRRLTTQSLAPHPEISLSRRISDLPIIRKFFTSDMSRRLSNLFIKPPERVEKVPETVPEG
eukprot:GEMP01018557.1.p1 GENE.GEMP01018557.1~~GEMP01018557.1.p1  ORF type:complete len:696 (+),score=111.82 GEMP01018557.1:24-2111(+)